MREIALMEEIAVEWKLISVSVKGFAGIVV